MNTFSDNYERLMCSDGKVTKISLRGNQVTMSGTISSGAKIVSLFLQVGCGPSLSHHIHYTAIGRLTALTEIYFCCSQTLTGLSKFSNPFSFFQSVFCAFVHAAALGTIPTEFGLLSNLLTSITMRTSGLSGVCIKSFRQQHFTLPAFIDHSDRDL